ncbi:hypothetical protein Y032_0842g2637 [Ancylostoma ceylanicum]|uniref:Uncharacterized protein n=1 Tax=Ancylostoma ceylanicum TaxID=53326 RepID=A0A016WAS7_9BILA|nr:hypothetical protein Y032_0842g2637 [Ancylostoma ceylanicum]
MQKLPNIGPPKHFCQSYEVYAKDLTDDGTFGDEILYKFVSSGHAFVSPSCKHGCGGKMVECVTHRPIRQ